MVVVPPIRTSFLRIYIYFKSKDAQFEQFKSSLENAPAGIWTRVTAVLQKNLQEILMVRSREREVFVSPTKTSHQSWEGGILGH